MKERRHFRPILQRNTAQLNMATLGSEARKDVYYLATSRLNPIVSPQTVNSLGLDQCYLDSPRLIVPRAPPTSEFACPSVIVAFVHDMLARFVATRCYGDAGCGSGAGDLLSGRGREGEVCEVSG